jgi:threonine synthase
MYFEQRFPPEFDIKPDPDLINVPVYVHPKDLKQVLAPGKPLTDSALNTFVRRVSENIAATLDLKKR